ncbi:hypothetical protein SANBI_003073 [Sanguibacter sp. 4.1]|uniref:Uncharacterized protein n=1 Tax=Sanguibacter biliveldensis TaxID=3030830 RepID=A0AAF0Z209_9MICO|nr:hypothetical protein [Sanguibacter sp. 4.1]WPF81760.1 hypothetical protein SANBI_003073 [Sanguibacter sp. 4.1]
MSADLSTLPAASRLGAEPFPSHATASARSVDEAAWEDESAQPETAAAAEQPEAALPEQTPWEAALTQIEDALDEAEALVAPGFLFDEVQVPRIGLWVPPADLGPLPAALAARVTEILDRQRALAPRVEEAARAARAHLKAVGSMQTNDTSASVYVDAVG